MWKKGPDLQGPAAGKRMNRLGMVFPGQGAQYVGMGRELHDDFEVVRSTFAEARVMLGLDVASLCFEGPQEELDLTVNTQMTVLTLDVALFRLFTQLTPLRPAVMAGHSLGEYAALCASGSLSFRNALELVRIRSRYQQENVPVGVGSMAAIIGLERPVVETLCREISGENGVVAPAIFNAPDQTVVSGLTAAVHSVMNRAKEKGAKRAIRLPLSVPFHCPLLIEAAGRFQEDLQRVEIREGDVPVLSNVDPAVIHAPDKTKELLVRHISAPVRWQETIEEMARMGVDTIVEMGPRKILSNLTRRIDDRIRMLNVEDRDSLKKTLECLGA